MWVDSCTKLDISNFPYYIDNNKIKGFEVPSQKTSSSSVEKNRMMVGDEENLNKLKMMFLNGTKEIGSKVSSEESMFYGS